MMPWVCTPLCIGRVRACVADALRALKVIDSADWIVFFQSLTVHSSRKLEGHCFRKFGRRTQVSGNSLTTRFDSGRASYVPTRPAVDLACGRKQTALR